MRQLFISEAYQSTSIFICDSIKWKHLRKATLEDTDISTIVKLQKTAPNLRELSLRGQMYRANVEREDHPIIPIKVKLRVVEIGELNAKSVRLLETKETQGVKVLGATAKIKVERSKKD